jgi:hypothetical protein
MLFWLWRYERLDIVSSGLPLNAALANWSADTANVHALLGENTVAQTYLIAHQTTASNSSGNKAIRDNRFIT